jgi:predicted nucleic acid-binding protein
MESEPRAIDSNVILRYLLKDNLAQSESARDLIESMQPLGITPVALAEVAWTLSGPNYRVERAVISTLLAVLLARENMIAVGFDKAEAQTALMTCDPQHGAADFGDALIAACARSVGIQEIYSFDRRFARAGLTPVAPP